MISGRRADAIEEATAQIGATGAEVVGVQADVASRGVSKPTVATAEKRSDRVDIRVDVISPGGAQPLGWRRR